MRMTLMRLRMKQMAKLLGQAALAELRRAGGPLHGLDVEFRRRDYDWRATALLEELTQDLISRDAVIIAASECLFEYGSDEDKIANLVALRAGGRGARCVVGSVTRADELRRRMIAESRFKLFPSGIEGFAPFGGAGWLQDRGNTHCRLERSGRVATRTLVEGHRSGDVG